MLKHFCCCRITRYPCLYRSNVDSSITKITPFFRRTLASNVSIKSPFKTYALFGQDTHYGKLVRSSTRYHEPVRGPDLKRLLKKHRFHVDLIGEYKISRCCSTCHNESLYTFHCVPNQRLYQLVQYPRIVCRDLLR